MSSARIAEMLDETGLAHEELADVVDLLLPLDDLVGAAPAPSAELAELFEAESAPEPAGFARRRAVAGALVLALSGVGATGLSAAANTLPRPLQHRVSQFSHHYLPFRLPEPPPREERPDGLPDLAPGVAPLTGSGRLDPASRSITARPHDPDAHAPGDATDSQSSPMVRPGSTPSSDPSAAPAYATESSGPEPAAQPNMSGSPTPTDDPRGAPAKGNDGRGHTHDPDKGNGKGAGNGNGNGGPAGKPGKGNGGPAPAPAEPVPAEPAPTPALPIPTLPLPNPVPGVGGGDGTGSVDTGGVNLP